MAVGVQHGPGVGGGLNGPQATLPGGLDPDGRLGAEHIRPVGQQHIRIVLIGGQGQHLPQLLQGLRLGTLQQLAAQAAAAPQVDLLLHQPTLGIHVLVHGHV